MLNKYSLKIQSSILLFILDIICMRNKSAERTIAYMVVTIDVQQAVERNTVVTVFKAKRIRPLINITSTLGLYCKHCAHVHKSNLQISKKNKYVITIIIIGLWFYIIHIILIIVL